MQASYPANLPNTILISFAAQIGVSAHSVYCIITVSPQGHVLCERHTQAGISTNVLGMQECLWDWGSVCRAGTPASGLGDTLCMPPSGPCPQCQFRDPQICLKLNSNQGLLGGPMHGARPARAAALNSACWTQETGCWRLGSWQSSSIAPWLCGLGPVVSSPQGLSPFLCKMASISTPSF